MGNESSDILIGNESSMIWSLLQNEPVQAVLEFLHAIESAFIDMVETLGMDSTLAVFVIIIGLAVGAWVVKTTIKWLGPVFLLLLILILAMKFEYI